MLYYLPLRGSDVCCFDGFVNFDESGVNSESEKGVVNSRLCEFHVCWVRVGANGKSRDWCGCKVANPQYFEQRSVQPGLQNEAKIH